ncbi:lipocalin-like domain-containing protein [Thiocystis violacea]|uniref:lipocalin-like domain-containing protein n=1 Tax=Thiocystis violacea TaxID=13725 RepID=UPI001907F3F5|nr:lipocalin-like domain-containing protein [Thiocystis violacea]MBK1724914.1 carotenoid 1,2-hydratase [Thiocystis violacea]
MNRRTWLLALASLPLTRVAAAPRPDAAPPTSAVSFDPVLPGRLPRFPDDQGAHPTFRTEWWYVTGWLSLPDGSPLGFQCTFFRVRTGVGEDNPSAFAPRQLILAHAAIADPGLGRLRHAQRSARVGFGRAGYATGQARVWLGDWSFEQIDARYQAKVSAEGFAYNLSLVPDGPPLLNGDAGFSTKAPDPRHASYYYSHPRLKVSGGVTLDGHRHSVTGLAWMDHEWSSEYLPEGAQGWDWIGLNLDDGGALMAFQMRKADGQALWANATLQSPDGSARTFAPDEIDFTPLREWHSPRTGTDYPVEWRLRIGSRQISLRPLMDDQELDSRRSTGTLYWEGAVRAFEGDREIGRGYLEMTGYAERIRVG